MVTVTNRQTIYEMVGKGATLVIKRYNKGGRSLIANLVVAERGTSVAVDPEIARKAINSGQMRRLGEQRTYYDGGYVCSLFDRGFKDLDCEYWVMVQ